jgi:L-ascorbate metabolism protein UlaG (beta-lactamase superfamily)
MRDPGPRRAADAGGSPGAARLTWLGHSTVLVELDGVRVLTDPVLRRRVGHLRRADEVAASSLGDLDLVLVSHVHWDHLDLRSLDRLGRDVAVAVPKGAGGLLARRSFVRVVELVEGSAVAVGGVKVRATHAEHRADRGPLGVKAPSLGYILDGSQSIYFAGDTDLFPGMADLAADLDVALLPVAGWGPRLPPGHLSPERAADALRLLHPRLAVPIHWGTLSAFYRRTRGPADGAARAFAARAREVAPDVEVRILGIGESCTV